MPAGKIPYASKAKGVYFRKEVNMANPVNVNLLLDEKVKRDMERACADMGLSITTAFELFAKQVGRERRLPFEISADPFYGESNTRHLLRGVEALDAGEGKEHELIEPEE